MSSTAKRSARPTTDYTKPNLGTFVDVRENEELDRIEIRFREKPGSEVTELLKENNWQFRPRRFVDPLWRHRRTPENLEFAKTIAETLN